MTPSWDAAIKRLKTASATAVALNEALIDGDDHEYVVDLSSNVCADLQQAVKEFDRAA